MAPPYPDAWPTLETLLDLMVSLFLEALDTVNRVARFIGPSIWTALKWVGHELSLAGNALLVAILVLLLWVSIIYIVCLAIFFVCRMAHRYRQWSQHDERQPLLQPSSRRRRLPSWTPSNSSSERRRHHDHRAHRDLFRVEIGRRRQNQLRREQTRILEIRTREDRLRRHRGVNQHSMSTRLYEQHETIVSWLQTSSNTRSPPDYGTALPPRVAPPRPETRPEPPPPYCRIMAEEPPPYSTRRFDEPPAYH